VIDDDTGTVVAPGPLVVAGFPTTQAEVDADPDGGEAFSDFQFSLSGIAEGLRALGVRLAVRYVEPVQIRVGSRALSWPVPDDSGGVGYLLIAEECAPLMLWGVHTDEDLLDAAESYFGRPAPRTPPLR
jgi:hypothetical protein